MTLSGPELLFTANAVIAICGAPVDVTVDGTPADMWTRLFVKAGQKVKVGAIKGGGCRVYLAVKGGFPEVYAAAAVATASSSIVTKLTFSLSSPTYLGSKSTAPGLKYGGIQVTNPAVQ
jgi:allophanate hydrolase subunit 2